MRCLLTLILIISIGNLKLYSQYNSGTVIYSETDAANPNLIYKNYIVVDFDDDSYADIIMVRRDATNNTYQLTWHKGDGSGSFTSQTNIMAIENPFLDNEIFYADMNDDGFEDIVFQDSSAGFKVLLNDGQGNISTQINNEVVATDLHSVNLKEVADIDGDGDKDLLLVGKTQNTAQNIYKENCLIGYNDGSGSFSNYIYLNNNDTKIVTLIETGDIGGDGDLDIIYSGNENIQRAGGFGPIYYVDAYISVYENLGSNGFVFMTDLVLPEIDNAEPAFTHIKVQDINSDGDEELLIEYAIWDECADQLHLGDCVYFYQFHVLDYNSQNEAFAELETYNSWLHGYIMNELSFSTVEFYDEAFLIQFGHQNNDNNIDILSINVPQGKLQWYFGDGSGNFNNPQVVDINSQYGNIRPVLKVADIDNDTDLDVFVLLNTNTSSTLTVFKNLTLSPVCAQVLDLADSALTTGIYQAGTTVISSGNVLSGTDVTLKAGNDIKLQSGFTAPSNSMVEIYIDECN